MAPAALAAWMETPEGVRWLHQLVLAAHFSITLQGAAGIRVVCQFLELSGLSAFVGASYGTQQGLNAALEEALVAVADEQRAALARGMPHRDLTGCEDHPFQGLCKSPVISRLDRRLGSGEDVERSVESV